MAALDRYGWRWSVGPMRPRGRGMNQGYGQGLLVTGTSENSLPSGVFFTNLNYILIA